MTLEIRWQALAMMINIDDKQDRMAFDGLEVQGVNLLVR